MSSYISSLGLEAWMLCRHVPPVTLKLPSHPLRASPLPRFGNCWTSFDTLAVQLTCWFTNPLVSQVVPKQQSPILVLRDIRATRVPNSPVHNRMPPAFASKRQGAHGPFAPQDPHHDPKISVHIGQDEWVNPRGGCSIALFSLTLLDPGIYKVAPCTFITPVGYFSNTVN